MEFWGDDVEEIRTFAVADQRTLETVERLWAPPCRELLLTDEVRRRARRARARRTRSCSSSPTRSPTASPSRAWSRSRPVLVDEMELLVDLLPADTHVLVLDPERVRTRAHDLVATSEEFLGASWAAAAGGGAVADRPRRGVLPRARRGPRRTRSQPARPGGRVSPFGLDDDEPRPTSTTAQAPCPSRRCRRRPPRPTAATSSGRSPTSAAGCADGYRVVVVHPGHGPAAADGRGARRARRRRPGSSTTLDDAGLDAGVVTRHLRRARPRLRRRRATGSRCSPARTSPARRPRPATCARCRRGARSRSTRSSSRPATTSCTSSTASAASSR